MQTVADVSPQAEAALTPGPQPATWSLPTRLAFRFFAVYFTLYVLATQMLNSLVVLPWGRIPPLEQLPPLETLATWTATRLFGFSEPLVRLNASGDKPFDWSLAFCLVIIAAGAAVLWSALDRRTAHRRLHAWFRLFLRFGLGGTMLTYGMIKAVPLQMPFPIPMRLLEPYGHFSMMGVLWAQIGASPAYQQFTGIVEVTAALLLFIPGLTLAGALLTLAAASQVFVLNMTYDVPVKLFSFHLVVISFVLIAPEWKRLLNVLVLNRGAGPSTQPAAVQGRTGKRILLAAQIGLACWLFYSGASSVLAGYRMRGPDAPKPPFYGIWTIEALTVDGEPQPLVVTETERWRRMVIQFASAVSFQRMDDTFVSYRAAVDAAAGTLALLKAGAGGAGSVGPPAEFARFTIEQPAPDALILDGEMDGRKTRLELRQYDMSSFRLLQTRFRWVQDYPFNR